MPLFSAYHNLPFYDQLLHGAHFMICSFAVLIACVPLMTIKGSPEHKFAGLVYLPVSMVALLVASYMAWRESSTVLFCFNSFCAYLLLSGWRAVHEKDAPKVIDWIIPGTLAALALSVAVYALFHDSGMRTFYLMFFALNAFYLSWRDWQHLHKRAYWSKRRVFFGDASFGAPNPEAWLGRHVAGMAGSLLANLSVVVLTILPLSMHWLWPVSLLLTGAWIARKERAKKAEVRKVMATVLQGKFRNPAPAREDGDFRKAA